MKAIHMARTGGLEVLEYVDLPDPAPGLGEVLIDVERIGINFIDTYVRRGMYPRPLPLIPGYEVAGTVTEIGADVDEISVGDRVAMAGLSMGSYAEKMVIPEWQAVKVPEGVSMEEATAVLEQGMTAHYLCYSTYPLGPEDTCLIHAGAGGVGRLLIQMAKQLGATVITTVSTEQKADMARSVGADHVVLYTEKDFREETMRITDGRGVDVVYDSVGQATADDSLASLRPRGMMVLYGAASGAVKSLPVSVINAKSLFFTRPGLNDHVATPEELAWRAGDVLGWVESGELSLHIHDTYPLAEAGRAQDDLENRRTMGKVLLAP
ncbi:MAG: quinone oxidoreductase [Chloroflexota bacterium]|nr:quinone oxidoreductase [Chloroflexota bacterium]